MPRRFTKSLNTNVSPREYEVVARELAGEFGIAAYLRRLMIEDAARRDIAWPFETRARGQHRRQEKK